MGKVAIPSPFKITICGIDELVEHSDRQVTHVLSILDPATPEPEAFGRFGEHERLVLRFHDVIEEHVTGYDSPQPSHVEALLAFGQTLANYPGDAHLLIHCHMAAEVMHEVARIRSKAWPNLLMIEIGDAMLGRNGTLVTAVRNRHHELARALPHVADFMRGSGRERELL
jgi:predicted protein tyrosine phosphatase